MRTIRAALSWAVQTGLLPRVPAGPKITRAKSRKSRGRPLTAAEFAKILRATPRVVGADHSRPWRRLLRGLWHSGLRLNEALELRWTPGPWPSIQVTDSGWWLVIPPESEKGHRERRLPVVPDWRQHLERTPVASRIDHVYNPSGERSRRATIDRATHVISSIGRAAGVIIDPATKRTATAHDLRRSFAQRWAHKLAQVDLQRLMRHADIKTTLQYYLDADSDGLAGRLNS